MIESMAGKSASMHGLVHDATPFTFSEDNSAIDYFGKMLIEGELRLVIWEIVFIYDMKYLVIYCSIFFHHKTHVLVSLKHENIWHAVPSNDTL